MELEGRKGKTPMHIPDDVPLPDFILNQAKTFGDRVALINHVTSESWTYTELVSQCHRVASGLYDEGLRKGDSVVLYLPNCIQYVATFFGTMLCGGIVSGVISQSILSSLSRMLEMVDPKIIVTMEQHLTFLKEATRGCKSIKKIFVVDKTNDSGPDAYDFNNLLASSTKIPSFPVQSDTDPVICTFTSGSTGENKLVMCSHTNIIANCHQLSSTDLRLFEAGNEVTVMCRPCTHAYGYIVHLIVGIYQGVTHVYKQCNPSLGPEAMSELISQIAQYKVTTLALTPAGIVNMLNSPMIDQCDTSTLTSLITAGAPLIPALTKKIENTFKLKSLRNVLGSSECQVITSEHPDRNSKGVGHLLELTRAKMVDITTGEMVGPNKQGEVWLQGPCVCLGYKNNDSANKDAFRDGWFRTGDIGYYDEEENVYIVDRLKDIIKYDAVPVSPGFIESIILEYRGIAEVAVVGKPDNTYGELACAFVVLKSGANLTKDEIIDTVKENARKTAWLHGGVRIVDSLPKLPSGKIAKQQLRQQLRDESS